MQKEQTVIERYRNFRESMEQSRQSKNLTMFTVGLTIGDAVSHLPDQDFILYGPSETAIVTGTMGIILGIYSYHNHSVSRHKYRQYNEIAKAHVMNQKDETADNLAMSGHRTQKLSRLVEGLEYACAGFVVGMTLSDATTGRINADMLPILSSFVTMLASDFTTSILDAKAKKKFTQAQDAFLAKGKNYSAQIVGIRRDLS